MNIKEIFAKYGSDKTTSHAYQNIYELIIPYVKELSGKNILEIGYETGAGIDGFKELMPNKQYYSIDIKFLKDDPKVIQVFCDTSDDADVEDTSKFLKGEYSFSLIVDDGSHILTHQLRCLHNFWEILQPGGIYLIEDIFSLDHANQFKDWPGFFIADTRSIAQVNDICVVLRKPND